MKKIILYLFIAATFSQCTTDQENETATGNQNLLYEKTLDLSSQLPNLTLDTSNSGLYVGTIVSNDLTYHERIYININNDNNLNAQIISNKYLSAKNLFIGVVVDSKEKTYAFTGPIGSFNLKIENNKAIINDVIINNKNGVANVFKSKSNAVLIPTLGEFYNDAFEGTEPQGTWDIIFTESNEDRFDSTLISIVIGGTNSQTITNSEKLYFRRTCTVIDPSSSEMRAKLIVEGKSDASTSMAGLPLTYFYKLSKNNNGAGPCVYPTPAQLNIKENTWSWNGRQGTTTLDISTLPSFD